MANILHIVRSEFKCEFKRGLCLTEQLGIELSWNGRFWKYFKAYVVSRVKADACQTCLHVVGRLRLFRVFICLSMMMASTVLEGIQKLHGAANRSEGDIMKKDWSCFDWLDCVDWHVWACMFMFWSLCCTSYSTSLLEIRSWTYGTIELSWHMMRTWEETQTESEYN